MVAILCSGQGFQHPGMFDLVAHADDAQPVFEAAKHALGGRDPRDLVATAGDVALHANVAGQVLCCTQALAAWSVIGPQLETRLVVAGYSVGEVAAWGVAGALDAAGVFDIVAARAFLMDAASPPEAGLTAVRGVAGAKLDRLCAEADVHVAIRNGDDQVVLGGTRVALARAGQAAEAAGAKVTPLHVAVPSHSPLLAKAATEFAELLRARAKPVQPKSRLLSGIDGLPVFDVDEGLDKLARQVASTVEWAACMAAVREAGAIRALELGPGSGLATMMASSLGEGASRSLSDFRSIDGAVRWLER